MQVKSGLADGFGRCEYSDGGLYVGDWGHNRRHGRGWCKVVQEREFLYYGDWCHDVIEGVGMQVDIDGSVYRGQFSLNQVKVLSFLIFLSF